MSKNSETDNKAAKNNAEKPKRNPKFYKNHAKDNGLEPVSLTRYRQSSRRKLGGDKKNPTEFDRIRKMLNENLPPIEYPVVKVMPNKAAVMICRNLDKLYNLV